MTSEVINQSFPRSVRPARIWRGPLLSLRSRASGGEAPLLLASPLARKGPVWVVGKLLLLVVDRIRVDPDTAGDIFDEQSGNFQSLTPCRHVKGGLNHFK